MSMQPSWRDGCAAAVHAAGRGFESLLVPVPATPTSTGYSCILHLLFNSFFFQKHQAHIGIYNALVILRKCLAAYWWTYYHVIVRRARFVSLT